MKKEIAIIRNYLGAKLSLDKIIDEWSFEDWEQLINQKDITKEELLWIGKNVCYVYIWEPVFKTKKLSEEDMVSVFKTLISKRNLYGGPTTDGSKYFSMIQATGFSVEKWVQLREELGFDNLGREIFDNDFNYAFVRCFGSKIQKNILWEIVGKRKDFIKLIMKTCKDTLSQEDYIELYKRVEHSDLFFETVGHLTTHFDLTQEEAFQLLGRYWHNRWYNDK